MLDYIKTTDASIKKMAVVENISYYNSTPPENITKKFRRREGTQRRHADKPP